jgi:hypothetical protein
MRDNGFELNRDHKFDIQLSAAMINERRLGEIFVGADIRKLETIELKSESHQWEKTGNIAIEFDWSGKPSGIAVTEAGFWAHELKRHGETLGYFMFPDERLKALCREAYRRGDYRTGVGDDGLSSVVLIRIRDLLQ